MSEARSNPSYNLFSGTNHIFFFRSCNKDYFISIFSFKGKSSWKHVKLFNLNVNSFKRSWPVSLQCVFLRKGWEAAGNGWTGSLRFDSKDCKKTWHFYCPRSLPDLPTCTKILSNKLTVGYQQWNRSIIWCTSSAN